MKKRIIFIALISFTIFSFFNTAYAILSVETEVNVPASCTVADTDGVMHSYPQTDSPSSYLAICALDTAIKNSSLSSTQLSNQFPSMGLFITAINDVIADPTSQYWAIYQNGNLANSGIVSLPVVAGDIITFKLNDFFDTNLGDQIILHISSLETLSVPEPEHAPVSRGGGGGMLASIQTTIPIIVKPTFDVEEAFKFLISQQKEDGSFGEDIYTDWTSIAFSSNENFQDQKVKLKAYFEKLKTDNYQLTDYERHTMALMSLGLNPYSINSENYIQKIINSFDGKQFGDPQKDNDDIFALIVLQNAGYTKDENIIKDSIANILSQQKENGSWDDNIDMTGAGIEALATFKDPLSASPSVEEEKISNALTKAKNYLKQNQKDDGGFGNISSTAWAIEGILALSEKPEDWIKNNNTPFDYLANNQDFDGGIKNEYLQNKIWETSYVLSAISGKTWNQMMQKFEKPKEEISLKESKIKEKILKKIAKNYTKKTTIQNTATVINSFNENNAEPTPIKKNWFRKFLDKIFNLF